MDVDVNPFFAADTDLTAFEQAFAADNALIAERNRGRRSVTQNRTLREIAKNQSKKAAAKA